MNSDFSTEHTTFNTDFAGAPGQGMGRHDLKRLLLQAAPLIIGVFVLVAIPLATAVWFSVPLEYEVTSELHFRSTTPRVMDVNSARLNEVNFDKWLTTQLGFLQGPAILTRVAENRKVRKLYELSEVPNTYTFLRSKVTAQSQRNSEIVLLSARMSTAEAAHTIIESVMDEYLSFAAAQEADLDTSRLKTLTKTREEKMRRGENRKREIRDLRVEIGMPVGVETAPVFDKAGPARERWADAESDFHSADTLIQTIETRLETLSGLQELNKKSPIEKIHEMGIEAEVAASPSVESARNLKDLSESELRVAEGKYRSDTEPLEAAKERYLSHKRQAETVEQDKRREVLNAAQARLDVQLVDALQSRAAALDRKNSFQEEINKYDDELIDLAGIMATLSEKTLQDEQEREDLRRINESINAIYLQQRAPARVTRASAPVVPTSPDYMRRVRFMLLAIFGTFLAALGLGLLRELTNQHPRTVQDIASVTPMPVLGVIPDAKHARLPKSHTQELLTAEHPQSPSADEYRRILARIIYPPDETLEVNSCLIASPTRGDGKTSLATNLAISLTQANRSVLLVDVCPLNASIESCFGLEPARGLAEVLYDEMPFNMLARETEIPNLKILGPGFHVEELRGKLASREMMQFLEQAEKEFDNIIFDSPPALLMSETKLIAPIVDGVIVTVGAAASNLGMLRRCLTELDQVNANIIGIVLNGVKRTRGGYMAKNLDLFYDYSINDKPSTVIDDIPEMTIHEDEEDLEPAITLIAEIEDQDDN